MIANDDEFIIMHISNFRKVKRVEDVVYVFQKILKHKKAKLVMVGDGPEREPAQRLCQELGILENTLFLGNCLDINEILCTADLFILPSESESFGLAALEAMAAGVPVISSNAGGLSEVNKYGFSGFLSDIGDINNMVENALLILESPYILNKFKKQAFEQATLFDEDKIIPLYEKLYQKVLNLK